MPISQEWREAIREAFGERRQVDVAELTGISQPWVNQMLNGRVPTRETLALLCDRLGVAPEVRSRLFRAAGYVDLNASADEHAADEEWKRGVAALEAEFGVFVVGSTEVYKDRRTVEAARRDLDTLRKALEGRRNVGGSGSASGESGGGSYRPNGPGGAGGVAGAPRYPRGGIRQPQPLPAAP